MGIPTLFNRMGVALTPTPIDENDYLCFTANTDNSAVKFVKMGSPADISLEYSTDNKKTWNEYTVDDTIPITNGKKVYFRGDNATFSQADNAYYRVNLSGNVNADGNVMSLVDKTCQQTSVDNFMFYDLFSNDSNLKTAPKLPATTLGTASYSGMFFNTGIKEMPNLPATTMQSACYAGMFRSCRSLTGVMEELPATTLAPDCYKGMFRECNFANAPILPATTLSTGCYNEMFQGNTNIFKVMAFFTSNAANCTTNWLEGTANRGVLYVPDAATNVNVPDDWNKESADPLYIISETSSYIELDKVGSHTQSYPVALEYKINDGSWQDYTFNTQIALNANDKVSFRGDNELFTQNWSNYYNFAFGDGTFRAGGNVMSLLDKSCKQNVVPSGTYDNTAHTYTFAYLFNNCSGLLTPPSLPATELEAAACYAGMFANCSELLKVPSLPAQDGEKTFGAIYYQMFQNCTSIKDVTVLKVKKFDKYYALREMFSGCISLSAIEVDFETWPTSTSNAATYNWVYTVAPNGIFTCPPGLQETYSADRMPYGWEWNPTALCFKSTGTTSLSAVGYSKDTSASQAGVSYSFEYSTDGLNWTSQTITTNASWSKVKNFGNISTLFIRSNSSQMNRLNNSYFKGVKFESDGDTLNTYGTVNRLIGNRKAIPSAAFAYLFADNKQLKAAPKLEMKSLDRYSLYGMYENTDLTTLPTLPLTSNLGYGCYSMMFNGCSGLTTTPDLPATQLADECYAYMFQGCSGLVNASVLPATQLKEGCYRGMFKNCTSLKRAALPAVNLKTDCYNEMFNGCTSLISLDVDFNEWTKSGPNGWSNATSAWAIFVNTSGAFFCPSGLPAEYNMSRIPTNWVKVDKEGNIPFYFEASTPSALIQLGHAGDYPMDETAGYYEQGEGWYEEQEPIYHPAETHWDDELQEEVIDAEEWWEDQEPIYHEGEEQWVSAPSAICVNLEYSTDLVNWLPYDTAISPSITLQDVGDRVYFRGDNPDQFSSGENSYYYWIVTDENYQNTARVNVGGNIMSLLDKTMQQTNVTSYCFFCLFVYNDCILNADKLKLPATTISDNCYAGMFQRCSNLKTSPIELPATTALEDTYSNHNCYSYMFDNCHSLTTTPHIPASSITVYNGLSYMFNMCSSLVIPPVLSATTVGPYTYSYTFANCYSLSAAPELPATTLDEGCYQGMFQGCRNLTTAPTLSATTLAQQCYQLMFSYCQSLNSVNVSFTDWGSADDYSTDDWLYEVPASGTFYCPSNLDTTTRDASHVPDGWTVAAS